MTAAAFAAQRQKALAGGALSERYFAEWVELSPLAGGTITALVKITHEQFGLQTGQRQPAPRTHGHGGTVDELERILVTVNRDPDVEGCVTAKPNPGDTLVRSSVLDSDRRPYTFAGEVQFQGDQHAVYVYQRARRFAQGRNH